MHCTPRCMFTKKRLQDWTVQENVNLSPRTQALLWWINYTASRVFIAWQVVDYKEHDRQPDFWAVTLIHWKYMSSVLVCLLVQSKAKSLSGVTLLLYNSLWPPSHSRFDLDNINYCYCTINMHHNLYREVRGKPSVQSYVTFRMIYKEIS